jgi:hypothetical protein
MHESKPMPKPETKTEWQEKPTTVWQDKPTTLWQNKPTTVWQDKPMPTTVWDKETIWDKETETAWVKETETQWSKEIVEKTVTSLTTGPAVTVFITTTQVDITTSVPPPVSITSKSNLWFL